MPHTFTLETKALAEEFHDLLLSLDPASWREELDAATRTRHEQVMARLKVVLSTEIPAAHPRLDRIRQRLHDVAQLGEQAPAKNLPAATLHQEWQAFRGRAYPRYEALSASLRLADVHVPVLRPTNYSRSLFHVLSGLVALVCIQHVASAANLVWLALAFAGSAWTMEIGRRFSPWFNRQLMKVFGRVAHQHEHHRVNSATWYATALLLLALSGSSLAASLAVVVLALGDPAAALIGRRFGRIKIRAGRSLEGTLAFVAAGGLAALAVLLIYYPTLGLQATLVLALGSAAAGSLAELYSRWVDDNFTIPVAVGATVTLTALVMG